MKKVCMIVALMMLAGCAPMPDPKYHVGDVVQLKSGSPKMVISRQRGYFGGENGYVYVVSYSDSTGVVHDGAQYESDLVPSAP